MLLKKFEKEDVFIIPCDVHENDDWTGDFMITDGEHDFVVTIDNAIKHRLTSNGFVNVMTRDEFNKHKDYFAEEGLIDNDFLMLPDFTGEIGVKVVFLMHGEKNLHIDELDLDEYLMHQEGFSCEGGYFDKENCKGAEYCLTLPYGTEISLGRYNEENDSWEAQKWFSIEA